MPALYSVSRKFRSGAASLAGEDLAEQVADPLFPESLRDGVFHKLNIFRNQIRLSEMQDLDSCFKVLGVYLDTSLVLQAAEASFSGQELSLDERIIVNWNEFDGEIPLDREVEAMQMLSRPYLIDRSIQKDRQAKVLSKIREEAIVGEPAPWEDIPEPFREYLLNLASKISHCASDDFRPKIWVTQNAEDIPAFRAALLQHDKQVLESK